MKRRHDSVTLDPVEEENTLLADQSFADKLAMEQPRAAGMVYAYGTAGFRFPADKLNSVVVRCGMLAALRGRTVGLSVVDEEQDKHMGRAVGVVVTASHNAEQDNGLKLVDPDGGMLTAEWEEHATRLANAEEKEVVSVLRDIAKTTGVDWTIKPVVYVGQDTRESSAELTELLIRGIHSMHGQVKNLKLAITPQVHYMVREHNSGRNPDMLMTCYYENISRAFMEALKLCKAGRDFGKPLPPVTVDCANGVGTLAMEKIAGYVSRELSISLINNMQRGGQLNHLCGAEHVQKTRTPPRNVSGPQDFGKAMASVDGDADRIVFFTLSAPGREKKEAEEQKSTVMGAGASAGGTLELLDGDKITALAAGFVKELLQRAGAHVSALKFGVVQTAYANGASTIYLQDTLKAPVYCTKTGVKHLHHKAVEFDISIYFEANGHGTVLFKDSAVQAFTKAQSEGETADAKEAASLLLLLTQLVNQAIGDAVSDFLLVQLILAYRGWTLKQWIDMYTDLPSRMTKVAVKDRTVLQTTDAERRLLAPAGLQEAVDEAVKAAGPKARSFVRPSGTEDVVRVYAEAQTQAGADALAEVVGQAVKRLAGGLL